MNANADARASTWGETFTRAERAAHRVARRRLIADGGVPNLSLDEDIPAPPQPWLGARRYIAKKWHETFADRRDSDLPEIVAYTLVCVAERFLADEIRSAPGRVCKFAMRIAEREIADARAGKRRRRSGIVSLVNDARRTVGYADAPTWSDDDDGGEHADGGVCPVPECPRDTEDALIDALDALDALDRERFPAIRIARHAVTHRAASSRVRRSAPP